MTLLCLDVENTATVVGIFDGDRLVHRWELTTEPNRTADEWALLLAGLLAGDRDRVGGVCISSTVPAVLRTMRVLAVERYPQAQHVVLGPGVRTGLPVLTDNPREVGTDRIANALGAVELFGPPCIVVAFRTATTFDVVDAEGRFVGGVIAPGLEVSVRALGQYAAQLRQVEPSRPRSVVARNTVEALQSGAVFGTAALVDGIIDRIVAELGLQADPPLLVATGSLAGLVIPECRSAIREEPELTLQGMRIIFERTV